MNRKFLVIAVALMVAAMLATPLVSAKPGAEKSNEKFEYFELVCSGVGSETYESSHASPPDGEPPNVIHGRGGGWVTGSTVELTVGQETFDMESEPYSVDWTTTFDIEVFFDNDGNAKGYNIRLTDIVTVYDEGEAIGTLVLKIIGFIDLTATPPAMGGTVVGYGTEDLKGVHISAVDVGLIGPQLYSRAGTITGWPGQITNE